jgi:Photosystem II complex subunit Ycf12
MDMITGAFGAINWEVVAQLSMVGLIMIAGPVVIFVLAAVRGNM